MLMIALPAPVPAPVSWSFSVRSMEDAGIVVEVLARLDSGWHLYATRLPSDQGPIPTTFRFLPSTDFTLAGDLVEPEPKEEYDHNFAMLVRHHSGAPVFTQRIERRTNGAFSVQGEVEYMVCNDVTCLPPVVVPFLIQVDPA